MKDVHENIIQDLQEKFEENASLIYKLSVAQSLSIHDYATVFSLTGPEILAVTSTIAKLIGANHAQKAQDEIEKFLGEIDKIDLEDK